jgi:hypothetical protein
MIGTKRGIWRIYYSTYIVLGKKKSEVIGASKDRERVRAREAIYVGRNCADLSVMALATSLGVAATCVCRSVARVESRLGVETGGQEVC